jgi:hypothetical protein
VAGKYVLCQVARWVAGKIFIAPCGALDGGKDIHFAK